MAFAKTAHGVLHFETIDRVPSGEETRDPILFHHGIGASAAIWEDWIAALSPRYKIVAFDMRGYGRSDIPAPDFAWSLDLLIDDVFAVADAAGIERFHLIGESIGGTIALAAALAKPRRIATLTVSNGGHIGASIERVDTWRGQFEAGGVKLWSDIFMRDRFYGDALASERFAAFAAAQERWRQESTLNALGVLIGTDLAPRLGALACPVLILHPDASPFIPVSVAAELHRLLPDSELNVIGHARHGLPFSHGKECAALVGGFFERRGNGP